MTGYGKAEAVIGHRKYSIEVRSLNSKQFDLNARIPTLFREKEMELRKHLRSRITRGKCDFFLYYETDPTQLRHKVNAPIVESYIDQLKEVAEAKDQRISELLALAIKMPDAMSSPSEELDEGVWSQLEEVINVALANFDAFRENEGKAIEADFAEGIRLIGEMSKDLAPLLEAREARVRERIRTSLEEVVDKTRIDEGRFEQEVLYYMEKNDVSEERSRLAAHCKHFNEIMENGIGAGKKLGFVAQEIGREINTLGSKSNDADMQRVVVRMKDELEKIKEQILNVL